MKKNTLYFIGLGLFDEQDLTLKALNTISKCDQVFAEFYTSTMMGATIQSLENTIGKKITILSREDTENANILFSSLKNGNIAFLSGGDSMTATTHVDIRIRAIKNGFRTKIIHGTSVLTAVPGLLGLQHYKFGRITTLVTPENSYFPTSPYDVIKQNKKNGLHTLVLLDIQKDKHNFMTATEGIKLLLQMEELRKEQVIKEDDLICVVARAGSQKPFIKSDVISKMIHHDFGPPLHTIVYPGKLHFMEKEALSIFSLR